MENIYATIVAGAMAMFVLGMLLGQAMTQSKVKKYLKDRGTEISFGGDE